MTADIEELPPVTSAVALLPADQLSAIGVTQEGLRQLRQTALDVSDEQAHDLTMIVVKTRTKLVGIADKLKEPHTNYVKSVNTELARLVDELKEIEAIVRVKKDAHEARVKAQKEERERVAAAKLQERTQQVINLGMVWNGAGYDLDEFTVDSIEIKACPDEQWNDIIAGITAHVEQVRENQRIAAENAERERKAEADRLEQQRIEQEAAQKLIDDQNKAIDDQKRELAQMRLQARSECLVVLGFTETSKGLIDKNYASYPHSLLSEMSSEQFEETITDYKQWKAEQAQIRIQKEADNALYDARHMQMNNVSFLFEPSIHQEFQNAHTKAEIIAFSDEEFQQIISNAEKRNTDYVAEQEAAATAKRKADKARTARLKTERGVFIGHLTKLATTQHPKPEQPEFVALINQFKTEYSNLIGKYRELVNNL